MFKQEMDEYEEAMKLYKNNGGANGILPLEEDGTLRSQSDPAEELATDSVMSSPVSTNTDNIMRQSHNEYPQDEHVFDRSSHYMVDAHHHQPLYQPQPTDFISNNQENRLTHSHHQSRHPHPIQQQLQQQPLQPGFIANNNALQKPVIPSHPPSAPYDHF